MKLLFILLISINGFSQKPKPLTVNPKTQYQKIPVDTFMFLPGGIAAIDSGLYLHKDYNSLFFNSVFSRHIGEKDTTEVICLVSDISTSQRNGPTFWIRGYAVTEVVGENLAYQKRLSKNYYFPIFSDPKYLGWDKKQLPKSTIVWQHQNIPKDTDYTDKINKVLRDDDTLRIVVGGKLNNDEIERTWVASDFGILASDGIADGLKIQHLIDSAYGLVGITAFILDQSGDYCLDDLGKDWPYSSLTFDMSKSKFGGHLVIDFSKGPFLGNSIITNCLRIDLDKN